MIILVVSLDSIFISVTVAMTWQDDIKGLMDAIRELTREISELKDEFSELKHEVISMKESIDEIQDTLHNSAASSSTALALLPKTNLGNHGY